MEFGSISIRIFLEPHEAHLDTSFVERICSFAGFDLESFREDHPGEPIRTNRFSIALSAADGFDGPITIIEAHVSAKKDAAALFERILSVLSSEDRSFIARTLASRVDDEGHCFVRFDKTAFLEERYELVDHGKCVRFDIAVLTYPKSRDSTVSFLSSEIERLS